MVSGGFEPLLWDRVDLHLGENGTVECAVRWIKDGRIGLEFSQETRLDCTPEQRNGVLADVLASNFPEVQAEPVSADEQNSEHRRASRHPLIWSGLIHFNHDTSPVRLRNISASGALIESSTPVPEGAELLLDIGEAGNLFATVSWTRGDQIGLRFHSPFDLAHLSRSKPQVTSGNWDQPVYRRHGQDSGSPWGHQSLSELKAELEGFLKR